MLKRQEYRRQLNKINNVKKTRIQKIVEQDK